MKQIILLILLFIYAGLGAYVWGFWRNRPTDHYPLRRELSILFPALLLHAVVIWSPILSFGHALNLITWLMLLMYCIGSCFYPLKGLQILLYPIASFSLLLSLLMPGQQYQYEIKSF